MGNSSVKKRSKPHWKGKGAGLPRDPDDCFDGKNDPISTTEDHTSSSAGDCSSRKPEDESNIPEEKEKPASPRNNPRSGLRHKLRRNAERLKSRAEEPVISSTRPHHSAAQETGTRVLPTTILQLPSECLLRILQLLTHDELRAVSLSNRYLHEATRSSLIHTTLVVLPKSAKPHTLSQNVLEARSEPGFVWCLYLDRIYATLIRLQRFSRPNFISIHKLVFHITKKCVIGGNDIFLHDHLQLLLDWVFQYFNTTFLNEVAIKGDGLGLSYVTGQRYDVDRTITAALIHRISNLHLKSLNTISMVSQANDSILAVVRLAHLTRLCLKISAGTVNVLTPPVLSFVLMKLRLEHLQVDVRLPAKNPHEFYFESESLREIDLSYCRNFRIANICAPNLTKFTGVKLASVTENNSSSMSIKYCLMQVLTRSLPIGCRILLSEPFGGTNCTKEGHDRMLDCARGLGRLAIQRHSRKSDLDDSNENRYQYVRLAFSPQETPLQTEERYSKLLQHEGL